jgi:hypothetical protein
MPKDCPWCCEPAGRIQDVSCPHCGRALIDDAGRELRAIDVRYQRVEDAQCERYRRFLMIGAPVVAVTALAMPLLHLGAVAMAPIIAVVHLITARLYLTGESMRLVGGTRRRFNRWLARFAFLWFGIPGYAATVTPVLGAVVATATFAGLTSAVHFYARWSFAQEHDRQSLMGWEKTLLTVLAVATIVGLVLILALAAVLGWSAAAVIGWVSSISE